VIRVAYVCADPGVPVFGTKGSSVHVQSVVGALLRAGAEVELLAARTGGAPPPALAGVRVHALPRPPRGDAAVRERALLAANAELWRALGRLGPLDLVVERHALWSHAAMGWAAAHGVPGLLEVNAPLVEEQAAHRQLVHRARAEAVVRRAARAATALVAVSSGVAAWLGEVVGTTTPVHVVPNGIDPARFAGVSLAPGPRPFTVGFLGTLKPWHGLPALVEAFAALRAEVPSARLRVVGDGPGREALEEDLRVRGLADAAELRGAVAPGEVPGELRAMDVAVAPYPPLPGFYFSPLKVVEAMAAGVAVVASRVGDVPALVRDGRSGLLVEPGDPASLVAALRRLAADPALRARLGRAGRAQVLAEHTWDGVARFLLSFAGRAEALAA
jgi:glycosyltransferase involved in cell wall biosynthesis